MRNGTLLQIQEQGRYEEGEKIYLWALAISEGSLGSAHPNTMFLRNQYDRYLETLEAPDVMGDG